MAVMDREAIRRALREDMTIDIVTTGRKSGLERTTEIWFVNIDDRIFITGTVSDHDPGTRYPRDWLANLAADPRMVFRLKESIRVELSAQATVITDAALRRHVLTSPQTSWYRQQGESVDDLVAGAPLIEVAFVDDAAWLSD